MLTRKLESSAEKPRYRDMLKQQLMLKEFTKQKTIQKRYTNILACNMRHDTVMKVVYSKESLEQIQHKQQTIKVHHKINTILAIQFLQQDQQVKQNPTQKDEILFESEPRYSIEPPETPSNEKFRIVPKKNQMICLFDPKTICELKVENLINLQHLNAQYIWNNMIKFGDSLSPLIIIYGNSRSGKKHLLCNWKQQRSQANTENKGSYKKYHVFIGFLQLGMQYMIERARLVPYGLGEVLISVVGFVHDKMIDLLNIDQDLTSLRGRNLKIKREEQNGIGVQNLIQMGVRNEEEFNSIMSLQQSLKNVFNQYLESRIETVVYQVVIAQMNSDKTRIESIHMKFNTAKINNNPATNFQLFQLSQCLRELTKPTTDEEIVLPTKNSKLTFFLEDSLVSQQNIYFIGTMSQAIGLQDQLNTLKTFGAINHQQIFIKHNYMNDMESLKRIYEEDLQKAQLLIEELRKTEQLNIKSNDRPPFNISLLQEEKLLDSNMNLSFNLPRIQGHTKSSIQKKRDRPHPLAQNGQTRSKSHKNGYEAKLL